VTGLPLPIFGSVSSGVSEATGRTSVSVGTTVSHGVEVGSIVGATVSHGVEVGSIVGATVSHGVEVGSIVGTTVSVSQGVEVGGNIVGATVSVGVEVGIWVSQGVEVDVKTGATPVQKSGVTSTVTVTVVVLGSHTSYIAKAEEADNMKERAILECMIQTYFLNDSKNRFSIYRSTPCRIGEMC